MKTGTENKTQVRIAIVLGIVAVLTVLWALKPSGGTSSPAAPATANTPAAAKGKPAATAEQLNPMLRLDLLANSENVKYEGTGRNIFQSSAEIIPQAKVSPLLSRQQQEKARAAANVPPPPPPINLKFFGITSARGEPTKVFLSQGDDVWVAREGDVINRHYKVLRISPRDVEVEDLLNNNRQSIPLTQG